MDKLKQLESFVSVAMRGSLTAAAQLVAVLEDFAAPANGIYAVFAHAKHMPLRLRLDFLKHHYAQPGFWQAQ